MKVVRTVGEADLVRLKADRHDADRRYNEALTALDAALQRLPSLPAAPPLPDETQITPLNERWAITTHVPPPPGGLKGRLARFVLGFVTPALDQQQAFNSALVDHLNRNAAQQRVVPEVLAAALDVMRDQVEHLATFESRLIQYLQTLTPFVDTKDHEFHGLATRITEDVAEAFDRLSHTVRGLAAALDGVSDDVLKRWERYEGLRSSVASMQMAVQALSREAAARGSSPADAGAAGPAPVVPVPAHTGPRPSVSPATLSSNPITSHKYVAFEDLFRGDRELIRERQDDYARLFAGRQDVLDVGCGRGEFLQLLAERGVRARGIDLNHEMVALCQGAGLDVTETDALAYLRDLPDNSLGGLIALQVVEHLAPDDLIALTTEAFRALSPGSPIVLETINVASWSAFFSSYIRDLTHVRPLHPDTLRFLVVASGFLDAEVRLRAPLPDSEKLRLAPDETRAVDLSSTGTEGRGLLALADAFDRNVERLNTQLYGPFDYAVVAWKH